MNLNILNISLQAIQTWSTSGLSLSRRLHTQCYGYHIFCVVYINKATPQLGPTPVRILWSLLSLQLPYKLSLRQ